MPLDYTQLKVDQTLLHYGGRYLLISNINIPADLLVQPHIEGVLERIKRFILLDYTGIADQNVHYQVCATYDLRNTVTGEVRHWSGSFNPRGNRLNILRDFQSFDSETFTEEVRGACHPTNVYNKLRFFHTETVWVFDGLTSAIVSVQAIIGAFHPTVEAKGLLGARDGSHQRIHLSFHLA